MANSRLALSFRIFKNGELIREEQLTQGVIKIGKVPSAHLRIEDESVSRMHAVLEVTGTDVSLIDLGSTRGTFVNGTKINKAKLHTGDSLQIGDIMIEVAMRELGASAPVVAAPVGQVTMVAAPALPSTRPAMPPMPPPMSPSPAAMTQAFAAEADDRHGARAVEVAAMFGETVVDVKHCMNPKGGKVTPLTWGFVAGGLACLLTSGVAFAVSVHTAAINKGALDYWTRVQHKPAFAYRPQVTSPAVDFAAFGGLGLGLAAVTMGLARARREKKSPFYRIGTAPGVEHALESAPSASFPLVAPSGDDFVFNYGAGIDGELTVDGKTTSLAELAATGRARPSSSAAGAVEIPIPSNGKIRARSGRTTFLVSGVAKPIEQATPLFNLNSRTLAYFAGSLAAHLGVWALLQMVPEEGSGIDVSLGINETTAMKVTDTAKESMPDEQKDNEELGGEMNAGEESQGGQMRLPEQVAGTDKSTRTDGHIQIKDNHKDPAIARIEAIEEARSAGILGSMTALESGVHALASEADYSSGFDGSNVNGALFGGEGESAGAFGGGRHDFGGTGGGCALPPCGIIGAGRYGTIGNGQHAGDNWNGGIGGTGLRGHGHTPTPPGTVIGRPTSGGGLDKAIIQRYIKRNRNKFEYCYEHELLAKPGIEGAVSIDFFIGPTGTVQQAAGAGFDPTVASCVAGIVKNIEFPRPTDGGGVQVHYPFNFRAPGK